MLNFSSLILQQAESTPHLLAIIIPDYAYRAQVRIKEQINYAHLRANLIRYARTLENAGLRPGDRVIILLPVSADLYTLVLATMAIGSIPVLINPGQPKKTFFHCIRQVRAQAIVTDHIFLKLSLFFPAVNKIPLKFGWESSFMRIQSLKKRTIAQSENPFRVWDVSPDHPALITFTSGSSGLPKGVSRTHTNLIHQHLALKAEFTPPASQVDLPAFPVLTLHNLCLGSTTIMPLIRFSNVKDVPVPRVLEQITGWKVNTMSGPPAYLQQISRYCQLHRLTIPAIKGLVVGGAPVDTRLCDEIRQVFPEADAYIVYGSSEAEPIACISFAEFIDSSASRHLGYCVGRKARAVDIAFLAISAPTQCHDWQTHILPPGHTGEILVSGAHVCQTYFQNPAADRQYKLRDMAGTVWHRTGDIGFLDMQNRLWLVGRRENSFYLDGQLHYPFPIERVVQHLRGVSRAAVVEYANQLVVCLEGETVPEQTKEMISQAIQQYFAISGIKVLLFSALPVDSRHQSKINYPLLQQWVNARMEQRGS